MLVRTLKNCCLQYFSTLPLLHFFYAVVEFINYPQYKFRTEITEIVFTTSPDHQITRSPDHLITWSLDHLITWSPDHLIIFFCHSMQTHFHYNWLHNFHQACHWHIHELFHHLRYHNHNSAFQASRKDRKGHYHGVLLFQIFWPRDHNLCIGLLPKNFSGIRSKGKSK